MSERTVDIKKLLARHKVTQSMIAERAGVTRSAVSLVVKGRSRSGRILEAIREMLAQAGSDADLSSLERAPSRMPDVDPGQIDITAGPWRQVGAYEVNLYGLLRRRAGGGGSGCLSAGDLLRPYVFKSSPGQPYYTIVLGGKKQTIMAQRLVLQAHRRRMIEVDGFLDRALELVQRQRAQRRQERESAKPRAGGASTGRRRSGAGYARRCHDCGRPTNNYRCEACWARLRGYKALEDRYIGQEYVG
jgi:predicted XRE-type DNA-binding protein